MPPPPHARSLQSRLLLAMLVGSLACALISGLMLFWVAYNRTQLESRDTLAGLLVAVERTAAIGAYAGDAALLQEVADGLARNPLVARVEMQAGALNLSAGAAPSAGIDALVVPLHSPFHPAETVGRLRITADAAVVREAAIKRAALVSSLLVLQLLVSGLLLQTLVRRMVTTPLHRLASRIRAIRPGTAERIEEVGNHRDDEIGVLRNSGNLLLDQAQQALEGERLLRKEIEQMGAQYRRVFHTSSAGIFVLDGRGRLIDCNPTVVRLLGLDGLTPTAGADFFELAFKDVGAVQQLVSRAQSRRRAMAGDLELRSARVPGTWVHCLLSVHEGGEDGGGAEHMLIEGVMYDVTSRLKAEAAVRHRADHDALTGLLNRAALRQQVAQSGLTHMAVMYMDLDGFKRINDSWGHGAGDDVLRQCAQRLRQTLRSETDWIARIGGDEFMVVLPGVGPDQAVLAQAAAAVVAALAEPMQLADAPLPQRVAVSVGMACMPAHGLTWEAVTDAADRAMYAVKQHGKCGAVMAWPCGGLAPSPQQAIETGALDTQQVLA